MRSYVQVLRQYFDFWGRARRREFWVFLVLSVLISGILGFIDRGLELRIGVELWFISAGDGTLTSVYKLLVFIPTLAVGARRLHDVGRTGWWQALFFVSSLISQTGLAALYEGMPKVYAWPIIAVAGGIIVAPLIWLCRDSDRDGNKWGVSPKFFDVTAITQIASNRASG